ncbi:MAG: hypothetical protein GX621_12170, partial [Pirellulaceae bacterium]|nr:hypothetical protein [Pirellulaceae bacterium]
MFMRNGLLRDAFVGLIVLGPALLGVTVAQKPVASMGAKGARPAGHRKLVERAEPDGVGQPERLPLYMDLFRLE